MVESNQFRGSPSEEIVQQTFTLPAIKSGEVLVEFTHSSLCGSDIHQLNKPLVLGHEGKPSFPSSRALYTKREDTGIVIVEEVGITCTLRVGDGVGWGAFNSKCARCKMCLSGYENYCLEAIHGVRYSGLRMWLCSPKSAMAVQDPMGSFLRRCLFSHVYVLRIFQVYRCKIIMTLSGGSRTV